jgi:hypothetical protein
MTLSEFNKLIGKDEEEVKQDSGNSDKGKREKELNEIFSFYDL